MRKIFGKYINKLAKKDSKIVLITGDFGYGIVDDFKKNYPRRYFNLGLCEQSMIGVAAGMALEGLKPYVYTITPFLIERPFEQLKIDINMNNVNVKLIGYADYPNQGITHAEIDANKLLELLPNIKCYFPKSSRETKKVLKESHKLDQPVFISLKKDK